MLNNKKIVSFVKRELVMVLIISSFSCERQFNHSCTSIVLHPVGYVDAFTGGALWSRASASLARLEKGRYLPDTLYCTPTRHYHEEEWPGDIAGRLVLGQTLLQQATGHQPRYLNEIIKDMPKHLNSKGYMGKIYDGIISEQQLSGHGWLLRGLCEYYKMDANPGVLQLIKGIVNGLALPTLGMHQGYPTDPALRTHAEEYMGTTTKELGGWLLSSDVGCDFIFMDGVVQAYSILKTPELETLCYEMAGKFMSTDLYTIKAQTHASLTGMRALIRLYGITGDPRYLNHVAKGFELYKKEGMSENYENYNWFQRPGTWTEPCAVVDSYILALSLWQHTGNTGYLADAQLIWYNGVCNGQRSNGGFGLSYCCGPATPYLEGRTYEAHWCCTMRGAEGIAAKIKSLYWQKGDTTYIPDFVPSEATIRLASGEIQLKQETDYPFGEGVMLTVQNCTKGLEVTIKFICPPWLEGVSLYKNGVITGATVLDGFISITGNFDPGDELALRFRQEARLAPTHSNCTHPGYYKIQKGALLLGVVNPVEEAQLPASPVFGEDAEGKTTIGGAGLVLTPAYHLMDEEVGIPGGSRLQLLFTKD